MKHLAPPPHALDHEVAPRVGAWVETMSEAAGSNEAGASRPAWARGLKRRDMRLVILRILSRPAWARGLKH